MPLDAFSVPVCRAAAWSPEPLVPARPGTCLDVDSGPPDVAFVEPLLRRRLGALGRAMLHVAGRVTAGIGPVRSVFASRHGDVARTLPMLEDLARELPTSPAQFSLNVHNAVAGLWSIARQDASPSVSLAAGPETFGWGLLEAYSLWREDTGSAVLYVYGEDPLPELFQGFVDQEPPLHAIALLLGTPTAHLLQVTRSAGPGEPGPLPQSLQALHALHTGQPEGPWAAGSGTWQWALV